MTVVPSASMFFHCFSILKFPRCFPYLSHGFFPALPAGKMADETETADMRGKAIRVHLGVEGQSVRLGLRSI